MSRAILFVDKQCLTIVLESLVKKVPFSEFKEDYNRRFLDRIFSETEVFIVDAARPISREELEEFAVGAQGAEQPAETEPQEDPQEEPPAPRARIAPRPTARIVPRPPARRVPEPEPEPEPEPAGPPPLRGFFRSTAQAHIIVDDMVVGQFNRGGVEIKNTLAIAPGQVLNLSLFDPATVEKSYILKQLISTGVLVPCSVAAAGAAMNEQQKRAQQDGRSSLEIIGTGRPGTAEDHAFAIRMGDVRSDDVVDVPVADGPLTRAETAEFDPDAPIPENPEELMQAIGATDQPSKAAAAAIPVPTGDPRRTVIVRNPAKK